MSRSFLSRALALCGLFAAGAVVAVAGAGSTVAFVIGFSIVGIAAVLMVSLVFYEVGRSEDREREAERGRRVRSHGST